MSRRRLPLPLLCLASLLGSVGCGSVDPALRRHVETIERVWPTIRGKSQAAPGVDADSYQRAVEAMNRAVTKAGEAARVE